MSWHCRKCGAMGGPGNRVTYHDCQGAPREDADSLDAAWQEAEAALPEGWMLKLTSVIGPGYFAIATATLRPRDVPQVIEELADTPAAALRALAAKLRER